MNIRDMKRKEKMVFFSALLLLMVVFVSSAYLYFNPPIQVFEAKVFDVFEQNGRTFILSYGEGKIKLNGIYQIEIDETYRIIYQSRQRNIASIVISIEKIS